MFRIQTLTLLLLAAFVATGCDRETGAKSGDESRAAHAGEQKNSPSAPSATVAPVEEFEESDPVKLTAAAVKRFGIRIQNAERKSLSDSFTVPATIALNTEALARIGSPVSGRVLDAKVRAGDSVKKDDPLLVIDSPELGEAQSDLLQKRTALVVATSAIEITKSGYDRAKKLLDESQGIALSEVQKREAEYRAAEGTLLSAKASVTAAENKLKLLGLAEDAIKNIDKTGLDTRYTVRSPLTGRVIERTTTLGELVRPERESLLVVADMSTLWVLADVPEARLKELRAGSKARVSLTSDEGKVYEGTVSFVSPRLDVSTRTASVRIELPADGSALMPGMFAQAEISVPASEPPVLAVPESAVQTIDGKTQVFVPVKGVAYAFVARRVKTGAAVGRWFPVVGGLKEGEPYVADGSFILKADLGKGAVQEE